MIRCVHVLSRSMIHLEAIQYQQLTKCVSTPQVVHAVMDSVAPRMMELLEEELQRRATQKNKQEDGESERTTTGGEFSKL